MATFCLPESVTFEAGGWLLVVGCCLVLVLVLVLVWLVIFPDQFYLSRSILVAKRLNASEVPRAF